MAEIGRLSFWRHLRAEPNQFILYYRHGKLIHSGPGLAFWFHPLAASVAQIPGEDIETTFVLNERSADYQEIKVQVTLTYRIANPEKAAQRVNFSISLDSGAWIEQPLERLANLWANRAQQPARTCLTAMSIVDVVRTGADQTHDAIESALRSDAEIEAMGLALVSIQVDRAAPTVELEKALQTPTREGIQQKADQAIFERRALAVEKERAIKENELATEIELARRQEELIRQQGANEMLGARQEAEREKFRVTSQVEQNTIMAEGNAQQERIRAQAQADAKRLILETEIEAETRRVNMWKDAPPAVILGLAMQQFAGKVARIENLNLTPDLLGETLQRLLFDQTSADQ
jgi:regulator of protease activity HflC (stomatin/prohibitin superfamily)